MWARGKKEIKVSSEEAMNAPWKAETPRRQKSIRISRNFPFYYYNLQIINLNINIDCKHLLQWFMNFKFSLKVNKEIKISLGKVLNVELCLESIYQQD